MKRGSSMHGRCACVDESGEAGKLAAGFDLPAPAENVIGVESDAKHIGGNEAKLRCVESDIADHDAIDARDEPSLPALLAQEDSGRDSEHAGNVVQTKHGGSTYLFAGNGKAGGHRH